MERSTANVGASLTSGEISSRKNNPVGDMMQSEDVTYLQLTEEEFRQPITNEYAKKISELSPDELYDNYNPGPIKADGSVNFECHCVAHLVGSPCGYAFRDAITCQKSATDDEMEKGACRNEFIEFMDCVMKTQCFRGRNRSAVEEEEEENIASLLDDKSSPTVHETGQ